MERLDLKRRSPKQARARQSVSYILEATAQLLDRADAGSITTNHIAERAGVSVGSLYQYFRNKDDILTALARREMGKARSKALFAFNDTKIQSADDLIAEMVNITVSTYDQRPTVRKNLHNLVGHNDILIMEYQQLRLDMCEKLGARLFQLEPKRFRTLDEDEQNCIVMAWRGIIVNSLGEDASSFQRDPIKKIMTGVLTSYFEKG